MSVCVCKCVLSILSQHNHSPLRCPFRDCEGERECKVVWDTSEIYLMLGLLHIHTHSMPEALLDYSRGGLKLTILGGGCTLGSVCDKCWYHETSFSNVIHDTHMYHLRNFNDQHVFGTATFHYSALQFSVFVCHWSQWCSHQDFLTVTYQPFMSEPLHLQ